MPPPPSPRPTLDRDSRRSSAEAPAAEGLAERNRRRSAAEALEAEGVAEKNRRIAADATAEGCREAASIRARGNAEADATRLGRRTRWR